MLHASGADAVMIGRAAVGRPWLVGIIAASLHGETPTPPSPEARRDWALAHYRSLLSTMGIATGVRHARKHLVAYATHAARDGFVVPSETVRHLATSDCHRDVERLLSGLWDCAAGERMAA